MPEADLTPIAAHWDACAASFDDEPDHGLRDPGVRASWTRRLAEWLPGEPSDILDLGCGTGSLTLLLARLGHRPIGLDLSPRMIGLARRKLSAAGHAVPFLVGDAADPPFTPGASFDVLLVRHLLWTLPAPHEALRRWLRLLRPDGRLVLVEGRWGTSGGDAYAPGSPALPWYGGATAAQVIDALRPLARVTHHAELTDPSLWGRPVHDERYVVIATPKPDAA
ncbi:class I SAM-dependent methyltransferase [Thermoactinospora rubra]|uniref:class I SAM-dependent methyltransferase n=1 Tax=Thermoactinospora rubra TaxID=1088767 RepID=UPI000A100D91|nr:class I SAM-dependent methyltransferase [Thermoactinospora rubra]